MRSDDLPAVMELMTASLAGGPTGRRTTDFFQWKHEANPFGVSPGWVATDGSRLIGFRTFLRWRFRHGKHLLSAVRAVDTATHPDYQGRGIFRRLTLAAVEELVTDTDFIFNTPNSQSMPGYLKMGWQVVRDVPVHICPRRPVSFLRRLRAARAATPAAPALPTDLSPLPSAASVLAEPEVRDFLDRLILGASIRTDLSASYADWRYTQAPDLDYRAVVHRGPTGVDAVGVARLRRRGPLVELSVADVFASAGDTQLRRAVLRRFATHAGAVDHCCAISHRGNRIELVASGYLPAPGQTITLVARPLRPGPVDVLDARRWAPSLGDLELF